MSRLPALRILLSTKSPTLSLLWEWTGWTLLRRRGAGRAASGVTSKLQSTSTCLNISGRHCQTRYFSLNICIIIITIYYLFFLFQIISYTFPESSTDFPFYDIVRYGAQYVDYFNAYRATQADIQDALDAGLPSNKVGG